MKDRRITSYQWITLFLGVCFIALAFLADKLGLGGKYGGAGFGTVQWVVLGAGIFLGLCALIHKTLAKIVCINLVLCMTTILLLDNLLYLYVAKLPYGIVQYLSDAAKARRVEKIGRHESTDIEYEFDKNYALFYTGRPNHDRFDELGYRNPSGYIAEQEKIDVLLIGDSFIEGIGTTVTVADYLREMLKPLSVYSLGIGGQGLQHWKFNFERFVNSEYFKEAPDVVVLNYYGENDKEDTYTFHRYERYYGKLNPSLFRETLTLIQSTILFDFKPGIPMLDVNFIEEAVVEEKTDVSDVQEIDEVITLTEIEVEKVKTDSEATMDILEKESSEESSNQPIQLWSAAEDPVYEEDMLIFDSIRSAVEAIRSIYSDTRIILSYIPTTQSVYQDASTQQHNSNILRKWADQMGIEYIDGLLTIKEHAQYKLIHENSRHFNEEGYRIYSQILAKNIQKTSLAGTQQ